VELALPAEADLRALLVEVVAREAGDDHEGAHGEEPHDQRAAHVVVDAAERVRKERDEGDAGDAVGLEAVGRGADRVARVVAGAVGDDAGVLRVVLGQLEDDLHEVSADVGDLREDAAADAQRAGAEALADGEADEARSDKLLRKEHQDADHEEELDAHQQHAYRHAALERDAQHGERVALEAREGRAAVGLRVDADAEPRNAVGAQDAEHAGREDHGDVTESLVLEVPEVEDDRRGDQDPEDGKELALLDDVALARLPDDVGDREHRLVRGQRHGLAVLQQAEERAEDGDDDAAPEDVTAGEAGGHLDGPHVRQLQVGLAGERHRGEREGQQVRQHRGDPREGLRIHNCV